ncbi:MAG: TetR/AcrR family transcriptional regulator [Caldilineaceae bacterium]|nr:TetR/AcrR family transcriptional regulator [Caldilineaceae bacterium]
MSVQAVAQNSRESILDAAQQLIARHGYDGFSMRELSQHSGVAKSTLYHYFQDKREIYLNVLERDMRLLQEKLAAMVGTSAEPTRDRLYALIAVYNDAVQERGILALNALRSAGELDAAFSRFFRQQRDAFMQPFRTVLLDGVEQGAVRGDLDVDMAILSLIGMINGFVAQRMLVDCIGDEAVIPARETMIEHTLALYLGGISRRS